MARRPQKPLGGTWAIAGSNPGLQGDARPGLGLTFVWGWRAAERACNGLPWLPWLPPGAIRGVIGARGIIGARRAIRSHQSHQLLPHSQPPEPLGLHQVPWRTNKETRFVISISWPTGPPLPARRPKGGTHTRCTKGKSVPRGRCWRLLCSIALSQDASFETTFLG